ncbi:PstS family phosphate ABC transporter substrate-binding protein [Candidatus Oscillochloris fontis]|uniref:PstS family phosphate ABC transporter substrate-binding protein n=1 Tax=Candidatus Oscillochloris fontis TaxID=2496868 RepID=UPI001EE8FD3D|nr:PstS family phosphate ABC transporter substrate-binding protein [Candidatus Oscillochloris fontis]
MYRNLITSLFILSCLALSACTQSPATGSTPTTPTVTTTLRTTTTPTFPPLTPPNNEVETLSGKITIDGSSTVFPITEAAAITFRRFVPQVEISLGVSGTGGGFKKFCAGETVISDASRPIKDAEAAACAEAGIEYVELPIAFDGISVVVHPDNQWATCMTVEELRRLWQAEADGVITRWSQVRAEWPDSPINLYGAGGDSGTYDYFTEAIVGSAQASRQDYTASEDDYLLVQDLVADPEGLGFFGYAYYVEHEESLRAIEIDNGAGCVAPSVTSIADGSYQPLSRPIFLYVNATALDRPEVAAFLDFYLTNGPALVQDARYIPLPDTIYPLLKARLAQRITGSLFQDMDQVGVSIEEILQLEGGH